MKPVSLLRLSDAALARRVEALEHRLAAAKIPGAVPEGALGPDPVRFEAQRVRDRALDEVYFRVAIEPGQGLLDGTSTLDATTFTFCVEDFPAGAITQRRRNVRLRDLWPRTKVTLDLWYTSDVGSTNNFSLGYRVRQLDAGMAIGAPALVTSQNFTAPGPAVAGTILRATHVSGAAMLPAPLVCNFTFNRQGPDANANAFRWLLVVFTLQEQA